MKANPGRVTSMSKSTNAQRNTVQPRRRKQHARLGKGMKQRVQACNHIQPANGLQSSDEEFWLTCPHILTGRFTGSPGFQHLLKGNHIGLTFRKAKSYMNEQQVAPLEEVCGPQFAIASPSLLFTCQALEDIWTSGMQIMEWNGARS